jgi:hypothetical protein
MARARSGLQNGQLTILKLRSDAIRSVTGTNQKAGRSKPTSQKLNQESPETYPFMT